MEHSNLYDLIKYLERGTNLHIGVLFFGNYGNEKLIVPFPHQIHTGKVCEFFKSTPDGFKRCLACRSAAIRRAMNRRLPFGGFCVNGVYEYVHPIIHGGNVAAIIYIGNIAASERGKARLSESLGDSAELINTLEHNFTRLDCASVATVLESYVRLIFDAYGYKSTSEGFDPRIENVKKYIDYNLEFLTDASLLAKNFGYNKKYLGRLFKSKTGISIDEYVNSRRIAVAKGLLSETEESIINVAAKVGYNNVSYFNRVFKRVVGKTPSEWRREQSPVKP